MSGTSVSYKNNRFYDITVLRYFFGNMNFEGAKFSVLEQDFPSSFTEMSSEGIVDLGQPWKKDQDDFFLGYF